MFSLFHYYRTSFVAFKLSCYYILSDRQIKMAKSRIALICLLCFLTALCSCSKKNTLTNTDTKNIARHKSNFDDSTLYGEKPPFIMPYNRIIEGAGESVSFGEPDVENHSLDAVMLPDQKTLVVEDRFGLAFFDVGSHKLISRWTYRKDSNLKASMSSFSGIKSIVSRDLYFYFLGRRGSRTNLIPMSYRFIGMAGMRNSFRR